MAVAGRGGKLPPVRQGAYTIDEGMVDFLTHRPIDDHASNLGGLLAHDIATHPERLQSVSSSFVQRVQSLVGEVNVDLDLDAPLSEDDE